jgi:hypothetical protein
MLGLDPERRALAEQYVPPLNLTSDMLFALALCPTAPLQRTFPGVPFWAWLGQTPLVMWFSRITAAWYDDPAGARHCESDVARGLYNELTVIALLRTQAIFVPGIYATSERTIAVGQYRYGMPKQPAIMQVRQRPGRFRARVAVGCHESNVTARLLGRGQLFARLLARSWPRPSWPVHFPSGHQVQPLIQATPRVQLAQIQRGRLATGAAWLPHPARLWPIGAYISGLQMRLPP